MGRNFHIMGKRAGRRGMVGREREGMGHRSSSGLGGRRKCMEIVILGGSYFQY